MEETGFQIKSLEKYWTIHKDDDLVNATITKLVAMKIQELNIEINQLQNDLIAYENKYKLSSDQFYQKFQNGQLEDNLDYTDWIAVYKMLTNRIRDRFILLGKK